MTRAWRNKNKSLRKQTADENKKLRAAGSSEDQLKKLEAEGHGHCKEAKKLREEINGN